MTTPRKIEANRRNAQRSTGPRTEAGRNKVKFNALTHGLTAETVVLPHEDAAAYEHRLKTWTRELNPQGDMGRYLAERLVKISWQLDRADLHDRDRLIQRNQQAPADRDKARKMDVQILINRLFDKPEVPEQSGRLAKPETPREGPAETLARLEASAEGCRQLLAQWAAVIEELDGENEAGQETEEPLLVLGIIGQGHVLRLLGLTDGHAAIQAHFDPRVAAVVQIQKLIHEDICVRLLAVGREEDADRPGDDDDDAPLRRSPGSRAP